MADFSTLLMEEEVVMDSILNYIGNRQRKLDLLRKFSDECKDNQERLETKKDLFAHPIELFRMTKRLTDDWNAVKTMALDQSDANDAVMNITEHRKRSAIQFPTKDDIAGAALGLFRLQDTYNLTPRQLADGTFPGGKLTTKLSASDCYDLGASAQLLEQPDFYHSVLWLVEAYERVRKEDDDTVEEETILDYLPFALYKQGNVEHAAYWATKLSTLKPDIPYLDENLEYYRNELKEKKVNPDSLTEDNLPPLNLQRPDAGKRKAEFYVYEHLCRGENYAHLTLLHSLHFQEESPEDYIKNAVGAFTLQRRQHYIGRILLYTAECQLTGKNRSSKLYCYYKRDRPFLKVAPLKAEILHLRPKILIFREVISPTESGLIRDLARPKLDRAMISTSQGNLQAASYRISKSAWLDDTDHGVVERVSKRVEDMTDLTISTAENLQIANYGIGGHYESHFDFAQKNESSFKRLGTGNRIATVLFYISQPLAGGATVFPRLNLTLYPTENDAVVWYNLYRSGEGDVMLRHAACPVLSGVKWVANKWLHEFGQEFLRPCALNENDYE